VSIKTKAPLQEKHPVKTTKKSQEKRNETIKHSLPRPAVQLKQQEKRKKNITIKEKK